MGVWGILSRVSGRAKSLIQHFGATPELFQVMILVDVAPNQSEAGRVCGESRKKRLPWLVGLYNIGDYTTQLYRDYNKPL